jgi:hypothetical protein
MRKTAAVTGGKPIAVGSQSMSGVSAKLFTRVLRYPWRKGRGAIIIIQFCYDL